MKIRALIVDDEPLARMRVRQLLADDNEIEIIGECGNGRQAVAAIQQHRPDLVFLDVQMPRMNGIDVCRALTERPLPLVIFVTAYDQFALQAFEVHAIDYLLKPFDGERFKKAVAHAKEQLVGGTTASLKERLEALLQEFRTETQKPTGSPSARRGGSSLFTLTKSTGLNPKATTCGCMPGNGPT